MEFLQAFWDGIYDVLLFIRYINRPYARQALLNALPIILVGAAVIFLRAWWEVKNGNTE